MNTLIVALASAIAVFLSGCVGAFVSYKVTDRQIKAKFISASRQKWIDAIQELLAELISYAFSVAILKQQMRHADPLAAVATNPVLLEKIQHVELVKNRIALLLAPGKPGHDALFEAVDIAYRRVVSRNQFDIIDFLPDDAALITEKFRPIVRAVWERIKRGE